jgi:hypothetical protein
MHPDMYRLTGVDLLRQTCAEQWTLHNTEKIIVVYGEAAAVDKPTHCTTESDDWIWRHYHVTSLAQLFSSSVIYNYLPFSPHTDPLQPSTLCFSTLDSNVVLNSLSLNVLVSLKCKNVSIWHSLKDSAATYLERFKLYLIYLLLYIHKSECEWVSEYVCVLLGSGGVFFGVRPVAVT